MSVINEEQIARIWKIMESVAQGHKKAQVEISALRKSQKETDRRMKETDRQMKETDRQMKETDRQMKETDRQMKETDIRLKKLDELFNGQWGKLMETLVEGDLIKLLNQRNIEVKKFAKETEAIFEGKQYEYDIIAINGEELVVVEVKTTLKMKGLDHFINKLKMFKKVWPEYKDRDVYGAIAYLKANEGTDRKSEKRGLYVIRATGSSASIINRENFKPKVF